MASQNIEQAAQAREYENGWGALGELVFEGHSWSGNERGVAYLNLGGGAGGLEFVDVSGVFGLDLHDDGRALAAADWDADGDLDLWFKNRSGPQLRFMRNDEQVRRRDSLALLLEGRGCNRDAIGARVEVKLRRTLSGEVRAGEGYLAQSSRWLHLGLGGMAGPAEGGEIPVTVVHWPGAQPQTVKGLRPGRRYHLVQGEEPVDVTPEATVAIPDGPAPTAPVPGTARVVLRDPLALPRNLLYALRARPGEGLAVVINLWASWCAPCVGELAGFARGLGELRSAGIEVVPVSLDDAGAPGGRAAAAEAFGRIPGVAEAGGFETRFLEPGQELVIQAILGHVLGRADASALPTSLLVDEQGRLQIVYLGPVRVEELLRDASLFALGEPRAGAARGAWPGRWFYGVSRDLRALADDLQSSGRPSEAGFYRRIDGPPPRDR